MFDAFRQFDPVYSHSPGRNEPPRPLRRRKTLKQRLVFWLANLIVLPVVCLVYATIIADGIRVLMPIFQKRLYQLPLPGAGLARAYDGWNRADLAIVVSLLLFWVITWLWCRIFTELQGDGVIWSQREHSPILFYLLAFIAGVIILLDAGLFYYGLASQTSNGWTDAPEFIVPAATLIYCCGLALLGWWHSDYSTSHSS